MPGTNPKSVVSDWLGAAMAKGSIPHARHSGALIPATAVAVTATLRVEATGSRPQKMSGVSPVTVMRTYLACALAASEPDGAVLAIASAASE